MNNKAVTPAVGVILMVVITIGIAVTVFFYVKDYANEQKLDETVDFLEEINIELIDAEVNNDTILCTYHVSNITDIESPQQLQFEVRSFHNSDRVGIDIAVAYIEPGNQTVDVTVEYENLLNDNITFYTIKTELISMSQCKSLEEFYIVI